MKKEIVIIDLRMQSQIKTKCWSYNGEAFVEWDGVLLVFPDFYGTNTFED